MRTLVAYGVLAPPNILILLCLAGALIGLVWQRVGIAITLFASVCLFLLSTPAFSSYLTRYLETETPTDENLHSAQAIVVLGADIRTGDGPDRLGLLTLDNVVMAADAYHQLRLPVAVSGGQLFHWDMSVAALMKTALVQRFAVPVAWTEDKSRTTYENAVYTAQLLRQADIKTVVVVAQAIDLPRAVRSFERAGLRALAWPIPVDALQANSASDFLPSVAALNKSFYALHELIGGLYYRFQY